MLKNELSQNELKQRMNFSKMLDRQGKQIEGNSHIQGLLGGKKPSSKQEELFEDNILTELDRKFKLNTDRHLNTLDSIEDLKRLIQNKKMIEINFNHPRHYKKLLYTISFMCFATILWVITYTPTQTIIKDKIIEKTVEVNKVIYPYFAQKYINLRKSPSTKADKILVIPPNTLLKTITKDGAWTQVEFRDYINNKIHRGWIYGENFKKI